MLSPIGTHSGTFQADEALGVWLLRRLPQFGGPSGPVVRSRDPSKLAELPIVIDVGGTYDHGALRYDHHQRGFFETFDGEVGTAKEPGEATGRFKTKLSASGLIYKHYGRDILKVLHPQLAQSPDMLEWVYTKLYADLMEGLDATDNGIEVADAVRYKEGSGLSTRVHRLNVRWNTPAGGPTEDERFEQASTLCGAEFTAALGEIVDVELPARARVAAALAARASVDPAGRVLALESGGLPWKTHLYELERAAGAAGAVLFVLYADTAGMWRVQAVTKEGTDFTNRLSLPEAWRGVRDERLCAVSGIAGCKFCHAAGFIGGNATYEGALAMACKALEAV